MSPHVAHRAFNRDDSSAGACRLSNVPTLEAVHGAWAAALLLQLLPVQQERTNVRPAEEQGTFFAHRLQAFGLPRSNRVLMNIEAGGELRDGIAPVYLDQIRVAAAAHGYWLPSAANFRTEEALTSVRRPSLNASSRPSPIIA
jgi:hypothetical protein